MFKNTLTRGLAASCVIALLLAGCGSSGGSGAPSGPGGGGSSPAIIANANDVVVPEGSNDVIEIRLSGEPSATVTVQVSIIGSATVFAVDKTSLTFGPDNWDVPQTIRIDAGSDSDTLNDWGRIQFVLDGGFDVTTVGVTQQDTEGTTVTLDGVEITVKDASGAGAIAHPVTAVLPLPYGAHQNTNGFRIVSPQGDPVPAQFSVLNRWWARDNSVRHVVARFEASVAPDGAAVYALQTDEGNGPAPATTVSVQQAGSVVTVDTGVLRFTVDKDDFRLFTDVWFDTNNDGSYAASEKIVAADTANGPLFTGRLPADLQRPRDRGDLRLVVEESGPMRAVLRVSGLTLYNGALDHTHGFAVRIYAYAGKSAVKVDYQLQNSAKNAKWAAPLFFEDVSLRLKPSLTSPTVRLATGPGDIESRAVGSGTYLYQKSLTSSEVRAGGSVVATGGNDALTPSYGWVDVADGQRGMFVAIRNMAEMWPNGVEVESDGGVQVRLWPKWGAQWFENKVSSTGLYWLEDMQHTVKEVLFYFHGAGVPAAELDDVAKNFQRHPIPFVDPNAYAQTGVTLDLSGIMPSLQKTDTKGLLLEFEGAMTNPSNDWYAFGWTNFGGDVTRTWAATGGGFPDSASAIFATQNVDAWITAEAHLRDDLGVRPQWMAEYSHADDSGFLGLRQGYGASSWRAHDGAPVGQLDAPHLPGTGYLGWYPRDNQHGWNYHIEEFYYASANPWVRDWYEFVKEFRKGTRFEMNKDTFDTGRGEAHSWGTALQAYRVTGDPELLQLFAKRMRDSVVPGRDPETGIFDTDEEAAFQMGFMARVMIQLMEEVEDSDPDLYAQAFQVVWGILEWNHNLSNYAYYIDSNSANGSTPSSGTAMTLVDPACWFGLEFGLTKYIDHARTFVETGFNGGDSSFQSMDDWNGAWVGRVSDHALSYSFTPQTPGKITNLTASMSGGQVRAQWTTPTGANRFHVVWSTKPFSETYDRSTSVANPWAGVPVGNTLAGSPGAQQEIAFDVTASGQTVYVAVFSFGPDGAMSGMSNVASVSVP